MGKLWLNNELVDRLAMLQQTEATHSGINQVAIENELADEWYDQIRNLPGSLMYMPLSTSAEDNTSERNSRWKININVQIEKDDL